MCQLKKSKISSTIQIHINQKMPKLLYNYQRTNGDVPRKDNELLTNKMVISIENTLQDPQKSQRFSNAIVLN